MEERNIPGSIKIFRKNNKTLNHALTLTQNSKVPRTDRDDGQHVWTLKGLYSLALSFLLHKPVGLTEGHAELHILLECSCSAQAPSADQLLPVGELSSLSPGNQPGWQSGSPSGAEHPVTSWQPCCSFCAVPSIFHPAQIYFK